MRGYFFVAAKYQPLMLHCKGTSYIWASADYRRKLCNSMGDIAICQNDWPHCAKRGAVPIGQERVLFVMNGNLPDGHLRDAEKLVRVHGSRFTFFLDTRWASRSFA